LCGVEVLTMMMSPQLILTDSFRDEGRCLRDPALRRKGRNATTWAEWPQLSMQAPKNPQSPSLKTRKQVALSLQHGHITGTPTEACRCNTGRAACASLRPRRVAIGAQVFLELPAFDPSSANKPAGSRATAQPHAGLTRSQEIDHFLVGGNHHRRLHNTTTLVEPVRCGPARAVARTVPSETSMRSPRGR